MTDSPPSSLKRPRFDDQDKESSTTTTSTSMFANLSQWITSSSSAGFCHDALRFDETTRTLTATADVKVDTRVLVIPTACLVDCHKVQQQWQRLLDDDNDNNNKFHFGVDDLVVAWYLATQPTFLQPYIESLQLAEIVKALPRSWPADLLQQALQGSPLLARVQAQKQGLAQDYDRVKRLLLVDDNDNDHPTPSLEAFEQALAVVSSRAFAGKEDPHTSTCCSCLVPLLDLCNHQRGGAALTKNLRYAWDKDGNMVVHTARPLKANDALCITYGAQSNGQLLLNYGFCIAANVEPDGSSNNVYEFVAANDSDAKTILLRMGPKSYTYGPLVQVLEALGPARKESKEKKDADDNGPDDQDDMEAFLNECEEEDGDEEGGDSCMYMGSSMMEEQDEDDDDDDFVDEQKDFDRQALQSFQSRVENLLQGYPSKQPNQESSDSRLKYAQIMVDSEREILHFYQAMVAQLLTKLGDNHNGEKTASSPKYANLPNIQQEQIQSLVDAFIQIRYTML